MGKQKVNFLLTFVLFRELFERHDAQTIAAEEHQIWYTKRLSLRTVLAVHVLSLVLGCVDNPWFLSAKCGHHFEKYTPKIVLESGPFI